MQFSWRSLGALVGLSAMLVVIVLWQLRQRNLEQQRHYRRLAWSLRQAEQSHHLSEIEAAFLEGRYTEALRLLGKPAESSQRELQITLFLCCLYDLPWPEQVVHHLQLDAGDGRPRLLARVVDKGFLGEKHRLRLDLLSWNGDSLAPVKPATRSQGKLRSGEEWAEITGLSLVHLERKDNQAGQLWVEGRTTEGRARVEVIYGLSQWKCWRVLDSRLPRRLSDRVQLSDDRAFKLVDDEWVEVR